MEGSDDDKAFSSIDFVGQCLVDEERTLGFQKAIRQKVRKGDTVLDLGTGSGILSVIAADAGAKRVFAVEYDPFVARIAGGIFRANGLEKKISIVEHDARTLSFNRKVRFNTVLAEMLTTGMVDEHQVSVINNLHAKKLVNATTHFIPERQDTFIALTHADYSLYGLHTPMIFHLWKWHNWKHLKLKKMTADVLLNSISFKKVNGTKFKAAIHLTAQSSGTVNSVYLTSVSVLTKSISIKDTEALNAPMLIPIEEKRVVRGQKIRVTISYVFGGGYGTFKSRVEL